MSTLTMAQLEQFNLIARLSKERADYTSKQRASVDKDEGAGYAAHVKTLTDLLERLGQY